MCLHSKKLDRFIYSFRSNLCNKFMAYDITMRCSNLMHVSVEFCLCAQGAVKELSGVYRSSLVVGVNSRQTDRQTNSKTDKQTGRQTDFMLSNIFICLDRFIDNRFSVYKKCSMYTGL